VALLTLEVGSVFARTYRVVRRISAGGMGAVYEVEAPGPRRAALKIMAPEIVDSAEARTRFLGEATAAAAVRDPHVVEVYAAGVDDATATPFIAMEYLEGDDLGQVMRRHGALPPEAVVEIVRQLCRGLAAAHAAGLVHRDLKPQNVFLARAPGAPEDGAFVVKVLDFGIAKFLNEGRTSVQATSTLGTPLWMAPEQAEQGVLRPSTDVWALGLLVFIMLTGRPYWKSANQREYNPAWVLRELIADVVEPASVRATKLGRAERLPADFDSWFSRCVHRDPMARYRDAREALGPFLALFGASPEPTEAVPTARTPAQRTERFVWSPTTPPRQRLASVDLPPGATAALLGASPDPAMFAPPPAYTQAPPYDRAAASRDPRREPPRRRPSVPPPPPARRRWGLWIGILVGLLALVILGAELALQWMDDGHPSSPSSSSRVTAPPVLPAQPPGGVLRPTGGGAGVVAGGPQQCSARRLSLDVPGVTDAVIVRAGQGHTCVVRRDGGVWCWGQNSVGQLGDGSREDRLTPAMAAIPGGVTALGVGDDHTCALDRAGALWCWGNWQLQRATRPTRVSFAPAAVELAVGNDHTCLRTAEGRVFCFGLNAYGQLGLPGGRGQQSGWVQLNGIQSVVAGNGHTCALRSDGVVCWGREEYGALGIGSAGRDPRPFPMMVAGMEGARSLGAGGNHTCAVMVDGLVRCWGSNEYAESGGFDNSTRRVLPQAVDGVSDAVSVAVGATHTCAVTRTGTVFCWGANNNCQLGPFAQFGLRAVAPLPHFATVSEVAAGWMHTCARTQQGTLRCWGNNVHGQLGDGTTSTMPDIGP